MRTDPQSACAATGFVVNHARACQDVAARFDCFIFFRAPGSAAQGLIADNYSMKGFRIDTKSCDWGPMRGFVCADPRLSKRGDKGKSYRVKNIAWTQEALSGHINEKFFGNPTGEDVAAWKAGVMPIVISSARFNELQKAHILGDVWAVGDGCFEGRSMQTFTEEAGQTDRVTLPWRLMPVGNARNRWLHVDGEGWAQDHFVLCLQDQGHNFTQLYPVAVPKPIMFRGYETILGLINPGTERRGFKACVTADYDLFTIWPSRQDAMRGQQEAASHLAHMGARWRAVPSRGPNLRPWVVTGSGTVPARAGVPLGGLGNVPRLRGVDVRLQASGNTENYRYGDVSARLLILKTMLNTAVQGVGGYKGGNAVHHNDEAGNFALAKGSLAECLPVIAFVPRMGVFAVESLSDFRTMASIALKGSYQVVAKEQWLIEAGITQ
jgi:hypothetical protein